MRTFKEFPKDSICLICGKNDNKECVLIAKAGKSKGNIYEAELFHLDCIDLWYDEKLNFLFQTIERKPTQKVEDKK